MHTPLWAKAAHRRSRRPADCLQALRTEGEQQAERERVPVPPFLCHLKNKETESTQPLCRDASLSGRVSTAGCPSPAPRRGTQCFLAKARRQEPRQTPRSRGGRGPAPASGSLSQKRLCSGCLDTPRPAPLPQAETLPECCFRPPRISWVALHIQTHRLPPSAGTGRLPRNAQSCERDAESCRA